MDKLNYKTRKDLPQNVVDAIQQQIDSLITLEATQFEDCYLGWEVNENELIIGEVVDADLTDNQVALTFEVALDKSLIVFKGVAKEYYSINSLSEYITDVYDCIFW